VNCSVSNFVMLSFGGLFAGALGGLLGIGGGIVLMPLLRFVVGLSPAHAAGNCIVAVFFTTLGGSYRHHRLGHLNLRSIVPVIISGAVASGVFSLLFGYLARRGHWLDLGIGVVFFLISARMVAEGAPGLMKKKGDRQGENEIKGTLPQKLTIGAFAGILPGLLGIGTGSVLVPACTFILGAPVKVAMAASLACFCFDALISSAFKLAQGFMDPKVVLPICLGTLIGANLGAILNQRLSSSAVKLLFGLVFFYVSLKFVFLFFAVTI
jgi:uncharacterized membrane protein YfcA